MAPLEHPSDVFITPKASCRCHIPAQVPALDLVSEQLSWFLIGLVTSRPPGPHGSSTAPPGVAFQSADGTLLLRTLSGTSLPEGSRLGHTGLSLCT